MRPEVDYTRVLYTSVAMFLCKIILFLCQS